MTFVIADRVKETSVSTGTGPLTLAGASVGFQGFSGVCAVGDTLFYGLQAVDSGGAPTGQWECGLGTYSAANTLTRTQVTSSSSAGALVALAAGSKEVFITMPAKQAGWARERIFDDSVSYFVSPTGSNTNSGLDPATPFLTVQAAVNAVALLDMEHASSARIYVADGNYNQTVLLKPYLGGVAPVIVGNEATPGSVTIEGFSNTVRGAGRWDVEYLKVQNTDYGLRCVGSGNALHCVGIEFGTGLTTSHISAADGGFVSATSGVILDGAASHVSALDGGKVTIGGFVTVGASVSITTFAEARGCGIVDAQFHATSLGANTVTGMRYKVSANGVIYTDGTTGAAFFPGTTAGVAETGGQYI